MNEANNHTNKKKNVCPLCEQISKRKKKIKCTPTKNSLFDTDSRWSTS